MIGNINNVFGSEIPSQNQSGERITPQQASYQNPSPTNQYLIPEDLFVGVPSKDLSNSYFKQAGLQLESDAWLNAINAKAEIEKAMLSYNSANPDAQVSSFEELVAKGGGDYVKALSEKTGLSTEQLMQVSKTEKAEMVLKASKINEQIAFQYEIQDNKDKLMTAWLQSLAEEKDLAKGPNA